MREEIVVDEYNCYFPLHPCEQIKLGLDLSDFTNNVRFLLFHTGKVESNFLITEGLLYLFF